MRTLIHISDEHISLVYESNEVIKVVSTPEWVKDRGVICEFESTSYPHDLDWSHFCLTAIREKIKKEEWK